MSYVVANRVWVKPEYAGEFESRFRRRAGQIDQQPGFQRMEILKPASDETPWVVLTHWQDESAFRAWVGSDDFRLAHPNPMPEEAFLQGGGLEQYEVVLSAAREQVPARFAPGVWRRRCFRRTNPVCARFSVLPPRRDCRSAAGPLRLCA